MKSTLKIIIGALKRTQKNLNALLQNLMRMAYFETCKLKLLLKFVSRKLVDQLNSKFVRLISYGVGYIVEK